MHLILSLFDKSGVWGGAFHELGYHVRYYDITAGQDVRLIEKLQTPVHGIIAAPPCTQFSKAGSALWSRQPIEGLACVDAVYRLVMVHKPMFWAIENPPGRLGKYLGDPTWSFQPWWFGDAWTKYTHLWGDFRVPLTRELVRPVGGYDFRGKRNRSVTPSGFARHFANAQYQAFIAGK